MNASNDALAVLNDLLSGEQCALAPRVIESTVFVSGTSVAALDIVQRMARTSRRNREDLASMVIELGGEPGPRRGDAATAHLHFQDLHHLLPELIRGQERLVRKYQAALPLLTASTRAAALARRIATQHENDLQKLQSLVRTARERPNPAPA